MKRDEIFKQRKKERKNDVMEYLLLPVSGKKSWYAATLIFWDDCHGFRNANAVLGKTSHLMCSELSLRLGFCR